MAASRGTNNVWNRRARRFLKWIKTPPVRTLVVVAEAFAFCVVVFTLLQIISDFNDRVEEREARQRDRIAQAWETLGRTRPGDTGKGQAISTLVGAGGETEIRLDCIEIDFITSHCVSFEILTGIDINDKDAKFFFSQTIIESMKLSDAKIIGIIQKSGITDSRIKNSTIDYLMGKVGINLNTITDSKIYLFGAKIDLEANDISGTKFIATVIDSISYIGDNFSLANKPPKLIKRPYYISAPRIGDFEALPFKERAVAIRGVKYCTGWSINFRPAFGEKRAESRSRTYFYVYDMEWPWVAECWLGIWVDEADARRRYPHAWRNISPSKPPLTHR